jgi:hypothetical protein
MEIPVQKADWLAQIAEIQGIPVEDLKKYYLKQINDTTCIAAFPKEEDLLDYVDNLLATHIQEFHSAVMTEYEVVILVSSEPRPSKAGNINNNHVVMAKLPGDGQKVKFMDIENYAETGKVERLPVLSTGTIKVNVRSENDAQIDAQSTSVTEFVQKPLSWVPNTMTERREWIKKAIRNFKISEAGKNLSTKDKDGKWFNKCSLRWVEGVISTHRIIKKTDETTGAERHTGIITISDASVLTNPEFSKNKTVPDPKHPGKTMTEYGGFSAFVDPVDIAEIGKGSKCIFIGTVTSPKNMNVGTIIPILAIAPKKPSERLQKPGTQTPAPPVTDSSVSPASL